MIATSIEQSRRLLEAGLSYQSADMYWLGSGATISPDEDEYKLNAEPYYPLYERVAESIKREREDRDKYGFDNTIEIEAREDFLSRLFPSWSLSALWKIASERGITADFNTKEESPDQVMEILMDLLTDPIIKIMDAVVEDRI